MNEVSNLFVCLMGMGTTFVGLICIIFLTMLMGKVMQKLEKPEPPKAAPVPAAPAVPADGPPRSGSPFSRRCSRSPASIWPA